MTPSDDTTAFDPEAVRDKYAEERAKRMTEDRGVLYDLRADERFNSTKVIMLTARAQDRDVDAGFSLGADDYVTKPFSPNELRVRISAHLNRR